MLPIKSCEIVAIRKKVSKNLIIVSLNVYPKIQYKINHVRQTCQAKHLNNIQKNSPLLTKETDKIKVHYKVTKTK